jgi:CHAT domain-containing protein
LIRPLVLAGLLLAATGCDRPPGASASEDLLQAGLELYADENYDSARTIWTHALRQARSADDEQRVARILTELGLAEWRLVRLDSATARQQQAIELKNRLGLPEELSRSYNALGLIALSQSRNQEAVRHFEQAFEAARAAGDSSGMAKAAGNQALPAAYLGDFARAREAARRLREAGRSMGDVRFEANGLSNEAMVDLYLGDPRPAIARLDTALRLYARIVYRTGEQTALGQLATAWELTGDVDRSFATLDTALSISRRLGLKEDEAINLRLLAQAHERVGDYRRALRFYEQADTIFGTTGARSELGLVRRGAAAIHTQIGTAGRARELAQSARELHREAEETREELEDLLLLALIDFRSGGMATARTSLDSARALAERLGTRGARLSAALGRARIADLAGDSRAVLDELRRAARDLAPGDYAAEWETAALEARAHAREGRLQAAVDAGRRAVTAVERTRRALTSETLQSALVSDRASAYGDLVLALLRLGRTAEAFTVADAARSRGLLEHLIVARGSLSDSSASRLAEGETLLRRIDQLVQRVRESEGRSQNERSSVANRVDAGLVSLLAEARSEYEALVVRTAGDKGNRTLFESGSLEVKAVQGALEPGQALVEYLITAERIVAFVVTRERLRSVTTSFSPSAIKEQASLLLELWGKAGASWRDGLPASRALHQTLIAPLRGEGLLRDIRSLLIVPHGIIAQVPFAALQDAGTGRFLAQEYVISHIPSAAALPTLTGRNGVNGFQAATGFAPFPVQLPVTAAEVSAVRRFVPGTTVHVGPSATEASLRTSLNAGGIVHVATHGVLNARNPMFSRVELARGSSASDNDGRLEVHEIVGLAIRSPLVFFSGCETGATHDWATDPVLGTAAQTLAQATVAAGAAEVISTLWRINDAGAGAFAEHFYRRLPEVGVAQAFAGAQRAVAQDVRFGSPYYWAGYTLTGAGRSAGGAQE